MSEEKRLIPQEQEKPFDSGDVDIVSGVIDEFVAEQELVADLPPEQRAEVSRATLGKSITKGSFTRNLPEGAKSAQLSEKDANLLVREVAFSEAGAYEELLNLLSQGQVNSENVEAEARKAMAKSQGNIRGFFEKARLFIFGSQREEEDLKSREAFSFVTAELVRIMGEIFQSMDFSDEDENSLWKRFRISLSTTTLLPLTLLQVVRNIPIAESFGYLQDTFWLRRISRAWVMDRHGTLEKGKKPPDKTLQSDGSSHSSFAVHAPEVRERLQTLDQSEQFAIRLFSTLSLYAQEVRAEEYKLVEDVGGVPTHTIKVGFRTKERFYTITVSAEEIREAQGGSGRMSQFIAELARIIQAIKDSPDGRIEVPSSSEQPPKVIEAATLSTSAQRLLQQHAYEGRASLNAVDEALLNADVCLLLDPETVGEGETGITQRADNVTGGSHMKEVIAPMVDAEGNMVAEAVKFSHTWWQGNNGQEKQSTECKVVDFLSRVYVKKKADAGGNLSPIQENEPLLGRVEGVSPQKLSALVQQLPPSSRVAWEQALQSPEKETTQIPPEWIARHTIAFDTVRQWDAAVSRIREKWKQENLRFTVADLMNFAVLLAGDIPSIQGVKARNIQFEGRKTEVLGVLHVTPLRQEVHQAFQEFLRTGQMQVLESSSLRQKLLQYKSIKERASEGKSWASFFGTLTGGSIAGLELSNMIASVSRTGVMVGENVVNVIQGQHGLLSVLNIPRDIQALTQAKGAQQYGFYSANTSVYRPEDITEQAEATFIGALGVAPGGEWKDGNFEMTGLQITQRLLPDQGYKELRHFITTHQQFTQFREEILGALDDSLRVSHQREDGVQHTYSPEAFTTQLVSRNVPNAESIVQRLNRHMEEEYMPQFLQRIEVAMNWLLSVLEQE